MPAIYESLSSFDPACAEAKANAGRQRRGARGDSVRMLRIDRNFLLTDESLATLQLGAKKMLGPAPSVVHVIFGSAVLALN